MSDLASLMSSYADDLPLSKAQRLTVRRGDAFSGHSRRPPSRRERTRRLLVGRAGIVSCRGISTGGGPQSSPPAPERQGASRHPSRRRASLPNFPPSSSRRRAAHACSVAGRLGVAHPCVAPPCGLQRLKAGFSVPRRQTVTRASSSIDVNPAATLVRPSSHSVPIPSAIAARSNSSRLAFCAARRCKVSLIVSSWKTPMRPR